MSQSACKDATYKGAQGVIVVVRLQPNASRSGIRGVTEGFLLWAVREKPLEQRATQALLESIGEWLAVPAFRVSLIHGERSRMKTLFIEGIDLQTVRRKIAEISD